MCLEHLPCDIFLFYLSSSARYEAMPFPEVTVFAEVDTNRNMKQFNYFANRMRKVAGDFADKVYFNVAHKG